MKKFFAFSAFVAPFGITVNGTPVIGIENPVPQDPTTKVVL